MIEVIDREILTLISLFILDVYKKTLMDILGIENSREGIAFYEMMIEDLQNEIQDKDIQEALEAVKTKIQELKDSNEESMKEGEDEDALERAILFSSRERDDDDEDLDCVPSAKRTLPSFDDP